jgi:hypothetical protein
MIWGGEGLGKKTENLTIKRQCSSRHSNAAALEHKSEAVPIVSMWLALCVCIRGGGGKWEEGERQRERWCSENLLKNHARNFNTNF